MKGVLSRMKTGLAAFIFTFVLACALVPVAFAADAQGNDMQEVTPPATTNIEQFDAQTGDESTGADDAIQPEVPVDSADQTDVPGQPMVPTESTEQSTTPDQPTIPETQTPQPAPDAQAPQSPSEGVIVSQEEKDKAYNATHANMYRVYNPYSGEHLFTTDLNEAYVLSAKGWRWEGVGWVVPTVSKNPVYRLYNPYSGDHHYTLDLNEYKTLPRHGWRQEGIGWYSDAADQVTVYRLFNPYASVGTHHYTKDTNEYATLPKHHWKQEGVAWYATNGRTLDIKGFWLVTDSWSPGTLQRYWVDATGTIATSRVIKPEEGTGYYAYAKPDGAVVRGKYKTNEGHVLVAYNDGRIYQNNGWVVTSSFDGHLERYWFEKTSLGIAGAKIGYFVVNGATYYGRGDTGYVARGKCTAGSHVLIANNDGVLRSYAPGWLVTDAIDGGMHRYWFERVHGDITGARVGFFTVSGAKYYGMPGEGYVAHNRYIYVDRWYHANNDGVLSESYDPKTVGMMTRAQGFSSPTNYLVLVDTAACNVGVFSGHKGNWNLERFEACVCGAPGSPTITGTYSTKYHLDSLPKYPNAIHCTNIVGGYFFHSVLDSTRELGQHLSHGCVRLDWPFAKYIQTLPYGSTVNLY